jgi:hypothetical protein
MDGKDARGSASCVVCLDSIGVDMVQAHCGRSCADTTAYHAHCHAAMRSRCRLECAICRQQSTTDVDAHPDDDHGWLMFDYAGEREGTLHMTIVLLVAFVLTPPLLLARMLWVRVSD